MKWQKYYVDSANYWYQVHESERLGIPVPWQNDYLGVRKDITGKYWVSFPEGIPAELKHRLAGKQWDTLQLATVAAKVVAAKSTNRVYRCHVVAYCQKPSFTL